MASSMRKASLLRAITVRRYSSCPQGVPVGGIPSYEIKTTVLPTKIIVASAENEALISRVAVVFRAGARYESAEDLGAAHLLRIAAGLSTRNASQFAITRHLQQAGSSLTCSSDREVIAYTIEGTRPSLEETLPYLTEVATQQCFKPWELFDNIPRIKLELATRPFELRAIDLLHKAAYRSRGLGNSLYMAKHQIGKISPETLQHYVTSNFTTNRVAVVGLGVNHQDLVNYAHSLHLPPGTDGAACQYQGGEIRSDKAGNLAHIAVAGKGVALKNAKEAATFAVLQKALGGGTSIKYTNANKGAFAKCLAKASQPSCVTAFNVSYSDSGLFGALISAPSTDAGTILGDVVQIFKSGTVSEEDVTRGINQLKTAVLTSLECGRTAMEDMGIQAVLNGCVLSADQIITAIDSVSLKDVTAALKQVGGSKLSIASVGDLRGVPFLDELK